MKAAGFGLAVKIGFAIRYEDIYDAKYGSSREDEATAKRNHPSWRR
jgi:hypothetical protein